MSYTLFIGNYAYSSWSLRGWLVMRRFGIDTKITLIDFSNDDTWQALAPYGPARTVPTLVLDNGDPVWDSLAIAEELHSRHPDAAIWPSDPSLRALARSLAAEMHSGFLTLRSDCPMNLRLAYTGVPVSPELRADLDRIELIWSHALARSGGPWLAGDYSAADAFFAPVAARIAGYGLEVGPEARAYVDRHLQDPAFRRFRAMGFASGNTLERYKKPFATVAWPGPKPIKAHPVETGTPINDTCPYSGDPVTHLLTLDGATYGFCNAFCRDKTLADPEAWPAFMALVARHKG